ncbi:MAG: T9SS type A sorting domain-containing protein [Flavobacteriaceae bacterium]|nr:T9SS type A sorting domain-containing protein [Flavobacteriaceae bacterium]
MKLKTTQLIAFVLLCVLSFSYSLEAQERIAVIQSPNVVLLDPMTGDIIDPSFIVLDAGTPKALIQVGDEIWISYQIGDKIERYDLDGNLLSTISGGLDNIKGMALINESEVWLTNAGSQNGAPDDAIIRFDLDGNNLGFFSTAGVSAFDIVDNGDGEVYISYIGASTSKIERRDYDGNVLGNILEPGVVNFIQQIEIEEPGVILAAVFSIISGGNQNGLYRFSETDGSILDFWNEGNLRGVAKLGNGEILWTSASGVHRLDPATGISTLISGDSGQYFGRLTLDGCTAPPAPTGDTEQTFNEGATLVDIVVDPTDVTWFATEADALAGTNPLPLNTVLVDGETYYAVNIVAGCLSDPLAITVTITLNLNDFDDSNFSFHPNPTNDILYLDYNKTISEVVISNILGQVVKVQKANSKAVEVDMSALSNATYLVKIVSEGHSKTVKVIKQ